MIHDRMFIGIMCYEYVSVGHSFILTVTFEFTCCTTAVPPFLKHVAEDSTMISSQFIRVSCSTRVKCAGIPPVGVARGGPRGIKGPYDGGSQVRGEGLHDKGSPVQCKTRDWSLGGPSLPLSLSLSLSLSLPPSLPRSLSLSLGIYL